MHSQAFLIIKDFCDVYWKLQIIYFYVSGYHHCWIWMLKQKAIKHTSHFSASFPSSTNPLIHTSPLNRLANPINYLLLTIQQRHFFYWRVKKYPLGLQLCVTEATVLHPAAPTTGVPYLPQNLTPWLYPAPCCPPSCPSAWPRNSCSPSVPAWTSTHCIFPTQHVALSNPHHPLPCTFDVSSC